MFLKKAGRGSAHPANESIAETLGQGALLPVFPSILDSVFQNKLREVQDVSFLGWQPCEVIAWERGVGTGRLGGSGVPLKGRWGWRPGSGQPREGGALVSGICQASFSTAEEPEIGGWLGGRTGTSRFRISFRILCWRSPQEDLVQLSVCLEKSRGTAHWG